MAKPSDKIAKVLGFRIAVLMKERDRLRELEAECAELADNCDNAATSLEEAKRAIEHAREELSKYL